MIGFGLDEFKFGLKLSPINLLGLIKISGIGGGEMTI
jgi:hypothetical protein